MKFTLQFLQAAKGSGQGNAGGWPSGHNSDGSPKGPSGGNRSNAPAGGSKGK